jgi:hypothetical protein
MVLYRYGAIAWVWRVLIGLGLAAGVFLTVSPTPWPITR